MNEARIKALGVAVLETEAAAEAESWAASWADGEEGLARLAFTPPKADLPVQDVPAFLVRTAANVVIGFGPVGGVVTGLAEQVRIVLDLIMRDFVAAAHGLSAIGNGIHSGDPGGTRGCAHSGIVKAMCVAETLLSQLIDIGCFAVGSSVATDPGDTVVLAGQPEDIGARPY